MDFRRGQKGITVIFSESELDTLSSDGSLHRDGPRGSEVKVVYDESASLEVNAGGDKAQITTNTLVFPVTIEAVEVESTQGAFIGNKESVTLASQA